MLMNHSTWHPRRHNPQAIWHLQMVETSFSSINSGAKTHSAGWLEAHWAGFPNRPGLQPTCLRSWVQRIVVKGKWEGGNFFLISVFFWILHLEFSAQGDGARRFHAPASARSISLLVTILCVVKQALWRAAKAGAYWRKNVWQQPTLKDKPKSVG